jgi:hypothetical protein
MKLNVQAGLLLALMTAIPGLASAQAKPAAAPPQPEAAVVLPKLYSEAGYTQPEVRCRAISPTRGECTFPGMTAGRYMIELIGTATATGADANHAAQIALGRRPCVGSAKTPFKGKDSMHVLCQTTLLTDEPLVATGNYAVVNGTPDSAGVKMAVRRLTWDPVVESQAIVVRPDPAAAPAAKKP